MNTFKKYPKSWATTIAAVAIGLTAVLTAGSVLSWILIVGIIGGWAYLWNKSGGDQ